MQIFCKLKAVQWTSCQIKKSKPLAQIKVPNTSRGQLQVFRGHFKVILRSFGGQSAIFLRGQSSSMDKLPNKKSKPLALQNVTKGLSAIS